jgi:hypothetical protein
MLTFANSFFSSVLPFRHFLSNGGARAPPWLRPRSNLFFLKYNMTFSFRWFEGFSWECLKKGTLVAPYIPKVNKFFF